ncbi:MAG: MFS transporter [Chloroflexota bacterium]|nr:MFS transporter [Chloroflexota bacterium]
MTEPEPNERTPASYLAKFTPRNITQRYRGLLARGDARVLISAALLSSVGDWLNTVALLTLAYQFGGNAISVGILLVMRMIPRLLLQAAAGSLVDRVEGVRVLIAAQLTMAVIATCFTLLAVVPELSLLYALVFLLEVANTVARPAFSKLVLLVLPAEQRGAGNAVLSLSGTAAQFVGSLLGAGLLVVVGANVLFVLNGLTYVGIAFAVARVARSMSIPTVQSEMTTLKVAAETRPGASRGRMSGYRWLMGRPDVASYVLLTLAISILIQGTIALFVVRAQELDLGDGGSGLFFAMVAVGFVAGGVIAGIGLSTSRRALYVAALAEAFGAISLAVFGSVQIVAIALLMLVVTGAIAEISEIAGITFFQNSLPAAVFGRFFSLFIIASSAGGLGGALIGPLLQQSLGTGTGFAVLAVPGILAATAMIVVTHRSSDPTEGSRVGGVPALEPAAGS